MRPVLFFTFSSSTVTQQRQFERTLFSSRCSTTIGLQQLVRSPSEHSSYFSPLAFDSLDHHRIVGGRLVPHPCDDCCFGSFLDRDAFRSGHCATSNWRRMIGHDTSETMSKFRVAGMKCKERQDCSREVFDVFCLDRFTAFSIGHFSFGKALC